jgi:hypothetical protein
MEKRPQGLEQENIPESKEAVTQVTKTQRPKGGGPHWPKMSQLHNSKNYVSTVSSYDTLENQSSIA